MVICSGNQELWAGAGGMSLHLFIVFEFLTIWIRSFKKEIMGFGVRSRVLVQAPRLAVGAWESCFFYDFHFLIL